MTINLVDPRKNCRAGELHSISASKVKAVGTRKILRGHYKNML